MGKELVSIIIPIYNSQEYLDNCIKSVLNQTYCDIEIILVDDYSTDESLSICIKYARKDSRIRVLQTNGKGVSAARNTGICNAVGKYIQFLDSDDILLKYATEKLVSLIHVDNTQLVVASYTNIKDKKTETVEIEQHSIMKKQDYLNNYVSRREFEDFANYPWNKLYVTEIIKKNSLQFDEDKSIAEDALFNMKYLRYIKKISLLNFSVCNHYIRDNSLVNKKIDNIVLQMTFLEIFDCFVKAYEKDENERKIGTKLLYYSLRISIVLTMDEMDVFFKLIQRNEYRKYMLKAKCINLNYRIFKALYILRWNRMLMIYTNIKK